MNSINKISLIQFRNYSLVDFHFPNTITCITGVNGSGKTNLLDAVYYLCYTKSYFTGFQQHCVQNGTEGFRVGGEFKLKGSDEKIVCKWKGGKKEVFINDAPYEKPTDHIGRYSAVMIAPDDTELINGAGDLRRKWIDSILGQIDKLYLEKLMRYQRILLQRNAWLKMQNITPFANAAELEFYNAELSSDAAYLFEKRSHFIIEFLPLLNNFYHRIAGGKEQVAIEYNSDLQQKTLLDWLKEGLQQDLRMQRTTRGIHRDELDFRINEMSLKNFGSQGQKKSFLFAVKLAQYAYLFKTQGRLPILLLDDVFEKLDQNRMEALLAIIQGKNFGQVILTDTHPERIHAAFGKGKDIGFINL